MGSVNLFDFYGTGWDGSVLGNGAGFEGALVECAGRLIKDWTFDFDQGAIEDLDGSKWDFHASGEAEGVYDCFDEAALKSGGCHVGGSKQVWD